MESFDKPVLVSEPSKPSDPLNPSQPTTEQPKITVQVESSDGSAVGLTPNKPPKKDSPKRTAQAITATLNAPCMMIGQPLSDSERKRLTRDLVPVLEKYDVGEISCEWQLAATMIELGAPRVLSMFGESENESELIDDNTSTGGQGERENSEPQKVSLSALDE